MLAALACPLHSSTLCVVPAASPLLASQVLPHGELEPALAERCIVPSSNAFFCCVCIVIWGNRRTLLTAGIMALGAASPGAAFSAMLTKFGLASTAGYFSVW